MSPTFQVDLYHLSHQGSPINHNIMLINGNIIFHQEMYCTIYSQEATMVSALQLNFSV